MIGGSHQQVLTLRTSSTYDHQMPWSVQMTGWNIIRQDKFKVSTGEWIYQDSEKTLRKARLWMIKEYIERRRNMVMVYAQGRVISIGNM